MHLGMRVATWLFGAILLTACAAPPQPTPAPFAGRVVDLTHAFDSQTVYWPTEEGFVLETESQGVTERGYYYESHRFRAAEHGGTHIDAPIHFWENGLTVDRIPLEQLMGPAVVVDVSAACARDRDHAVDVSDLERWETDHGRIPAGSIVLIDTGMASRWPDRERYMGTNARGAAGVAALHFPGLHPDAARWLAESRRIGAVGLDTPSIDPGPSKLYESHVTLFEHGIPAFENVANLDALPATGAYVIALPMKIGSGSGAPLRIVAILPD
jgi:kynurenine formamidase